MTWRSGLPLFLLALAGWAPTLPGAVGARTFTVDEKQSRALIQVGKSGALSFAAGHTHEVQTSAVAGVVTVDAADPTRSSVRLTINAAALTVTGKGDSPADVPKVQETMLGGQVLDVQRYPHIRFDSKSVSVSEKTATGLDVIVAGDLTLHGVTRALSVPVNVRIDATRLAATGRFQLKQTDYGIKPVSVGGVVSVKNTLDISFTVVGR